MEIEFSIWLASRTRWIHLHKTISMAIMPRIGEYMRFRNDLIGDYFSWRITQITYRESGAVAVWTELLDNSDNRGYSFEQEAEFDEYVHSYLAEGWQSRRGIHPNTRILGRPTVDTEERNDPIQ